MATFQKRQKEAARLERRQEKAQKRLEKKSSETKGPQIEKPEPLPELALEIGPDGNLIGL
jgi:hypothetical protein